MYLVCKAKCVCHNWKNKVWGNLSVQHRFWDVLFYETSTWLTSLQFSIRNRSLLFFFQYSCRDSVNPEHLSIISDCEMHYCTEVYLFIITQTAHTQNSYFFSSIVRKTRYWHGKCHSLQFFSFTMHSCAIRKPLLCCRWKSWEHTTLITSLYLTLNNTKFMNGQSDSCAVN